MDLNIVLTPIAQYLQVRVASLPCFSCFLLWPGRQYFLNKNLLVTVCLVDEEHLVTYDLSMQAFPCGINVPHDEYAQPVISFVKIRANLVKD
jgi:hypothetical protein